MAVSATAVLSDNLRRGPSPAIWQKLPMSQIREDCGLGCIHFNDFESFGGVVTSNVGTYDPGYKSFESTGGTLLQLASGATIADTTTGVIELANDTSVDDAVAMEAGYGNAGSFMITGNVRPIVAFEARVKINLASIAGLDTFIGLAEKGMTAAATTFFTVGDAINNLSYIGFYTLTAAATTINAAHGKNGATGTIVNSSGRYVAQTYTKLGFVYDPLEQNGKILKFFQDGVLLGQITDCTVAKFPTAVKLTPLIVCKNDHTAAAITKMDMDWWKVGVYTG